MLFYLLWGGLQWLSAGGDAKGIEAARNKITGAIIGFIMVSVSYAIYVTITSLPFPPNDIPTNSLPAPTKTVDLPKTIDINTSSSPDIPSFAIATPIQSIVSLLKILLGLALLVTVFRITLAGNMIASADDADKRREGFTALFNALISLVIGLLSFGLIGLVQNSMSTSTAISLTVVPLGIGGSVGLVSGALIGLAFPTRLTRMLRIAGSVAIALGIGILGVSEQSVVDGLSYSLASAICFTPAFLLSYFRVYFYLVELPWQLLLAMVARRYPKAAYQLLSFSPLYWDEVIWFPLRGLDTHLVVIAREDPQTASKAIRDVTNTFRQSWAARGASLQLTATILANYRTVEQISEAFGEFTWLPDYPDRSLVNVVEVRQRVDEISRRVTSALNATTLYNRREGYIKALNSVNNFLKFFTALNDKDEALQFEPIARAWLILLNEEIEQLSSTSVQASIPNPYIAGLPVQVNETAVFAPRPDLVQSIENSIRTIYGKPTLALYGPRRMGKTSFLLHLPRLLPDEILPVFIDLQNAVQVSGLGGMYYNWALDACAAADKRRLELPHPVLSTFVQEPAIAFREWLDSVERKLGSMKLFFTFDEFEWLVDAAEKNPDIEGVFSTLRYLSQHRHNIFLLFAGARRLQELAPNGRWHDYFVHIRALRVSYLDEQDARRLLTDPIPNFSMKYAPGTVDEIIRLTHCQPLLVQLMGSILVDWLNSSSRQGSADQRTVTMDDVEYAARKSISEGQTLYFANLWEDSSKEGQHVLKLLTDTTNGLTTGQLEAELAGTVGNVAAVLEALERYQLVQQDGQYWKIQVELTRRAFSAFAEA